VWLWLSGSVVIFGEAEEIKGEQERLHAMKVLSNHLIPGRWDDARHPNATELNATAMFAVQIQEASLKSRTGAPGDDDEDVQEDRYWSGLLPVETRYGTPIVDANNPTDLPVPDNITNYSRPV
jgi:uncharacterized protein